MKRPIRIMLFGIGAVQSLIARELLKKKGAQIVSAIDVSPDKTGKDLGDILGLSDKLGVTVVENIDKAFSGAKPDLAVHATSSSLPHVYSQIASCVKKKCGVLSTCEELVYPYFKNPNLADDLDKLAKKYDVAVVGAGINPGFVMDVLPIVLTGPCLNVEMIKVTRTMNSGKRRIPYQKKVGTGLTGEEFRNKIVKKEITGHVGLDVSIAMIADALGWELDQIIESPPKPVLAKNKMVTSYVTIEKGYVAGLESHASGMSKGKKIIELNFVSHAGIEEEYDLVEIQGTPNIKTKIEGGIHGDIGTCAMIINSIPKVLNAPSGLNTLKDLPLPSASLKSLNEFVKSNL